MYNSIAYLALQSDQGIASDQSHAAPQLQETPSAKWQRSAAIGRWRFLQSIKGGAEGREGIVTVRESSTMRALLAQLVCFCILMLTAKGEIKSKEKDLYVMNILTNAFSGNLQAVTEFAASLINNRTDILPDHHLRLVTTLSYKVWSRTLVCSKLMSQCSL